MAARIMTTFIRSQLSDRNEPHMPCPFPGMDPYLETPPHWGDFVPDFLAKIRNALLTQLFPEFDVRIEEYVLVLRDGEPMHRVQPDVTVSQCPSWQREPYTRGSTATATAVIEVSSVELDYPDLEPEMQRHISIIHRKSDHVVSVMEVLSAVNKRPGEDAYAAYLTKRNELIASNVNLVELDLLRGGKRLPMRGDLPPGDYYAFVGRAPQRPHCEVISWPVTARLPRIPIPLLPDDDEAQLDLEEVFRATYEPAIFDRRLPYDEPLQPAPDDDLKQWIADRLGRQGR